MTETTAWQLIAEIKANYRYTYKDMTKDEMRLMAARWVDCLRAYTDEQVQEAFRTALCKLSVPPTVADIIGIISRQERLKEPTDRELWQKLVNALGEICQVRWTERFGYMAMWEIRGEEAKKVYDKMPILLRNYFDFESFCTMAGMTKKSLEFERSRFLKEMPELREAMQERRLSGKEVCPFTRVSAGENVLKISEKIKEKKINEQGNFDRKSDA